MHFHTIADKYEYMNYRVCTETGSTGTGSDVIQTEDGSSGSGDKHVLPTTLVLMLIVSLLMTVIN